MPWEFVIREAGSLTFMERAIERRTDDWGKVVTRYHYRKVGMDHLLSKEKSIRNIVSLVTFEYFA